MANGIFNSVGVAAFPVVPNPAAGTFYFGIDSADGHFKTQNSAGVVVDLQSGSSYSDPDAVAAIQAAMIAAAAEPDPAHDDFLYLRDTSGADFNRVTKQSLLKQNPDLLFQLFTDFLGSVLGDLTAYNSGTGASNQNATYGQDATNNALGVTQSDTGTTAAGRSGLGTVAGAIIKPTLARLLCAFRLAIEAVSSPTETFTVRAGLGDFFVAGADGTNGLFFRYTDLVNGGKWQCVSRAGGADLTVVDSGVAPDLDFHILEVDLNEAGTSCEFKIDGAVVATIASPNLPGIANAMGAGFQIVKSVGTAQRNLSADWSLIRIERSAAR